MKLAFICTEKLPSPAIRGGAIQLMIDGVAPYLSQIYDLTIFSIRDEKLPDAETRAGIHYFRLPRSNYAEHVATVLRVHHFDLIHVFNRPLHVLIYRAAAPESRFVLSLHNEMFHPRKVSDADGRIIIDQLAATMTVSDYIRSTVLDRFPQAAAKMTTVYSGIDEKRYRTADSEEGVAVRLNWRERLGLDQQPVILFAGRLSFKKGPHLVIQAMKRVLLYHPEAILLIAGGKWFSDNSRNHYIAALHRLAEPIRSNVQFLNYVPADEIPDLFLASDLFVCSSQWQEPLARVHYEAMAAGVPLITTNRGGNSEVVRHMENGWLIDDYQHPEAFFEAIDFLLANPETAKTFADSGRVFVLTNHKFSDVAMRMNKVYTNVLRT